MKKLASALYYRQAKEIDILSTKAQGKTSPEGFFSTKI